ncbi:MAG: AEC family transporter [Candidatus Omnitrophica bacterium]|nr:AEC family transporter [Candidatus Omnitrophota bacterium]MCM8807386.1 AEC family transporter [Candidatus Omnitrophota bacterium]
MLLIKILSVFLIIIAGIFIRKKGLISPITIKETSIVITKVFYPSLIFSSFLKNFNFSDLTKNSLLPIGTFLIMLCGYIYGFIFSKILPFKNEKEKNTFHFQCTINNYSFLPLPIILFLFGERYVPLLILSTFGSEISVWTIGILALTGNKFERKSLKNLLSIPMISILISVLIIFFKDILVIKNEILVETGKSILNVLNLMGNATIPIALFIAGAKMGEVEFKNLFNFKYLFLSFLRLILIPLTSISLFNLFSFPYEIKKVLFVVAIMPTAIASIVLSSAFESDSKFAAESVLLTHLLSLITIPIFLSFLK